MASESANPATLDIVRADIIAAPHGFLGRKGGVSKGLYAGLNVGLGSEDEPQHIHTNRAMAGTAILPGSELTTLYQIHSAKVITVTSPISLDDRPEADAIVTRTPGIALGILTADCVPVLFHDAAAKVVGAAHAGWKGAIGGVTDNCIKAMEALGAKRGDITAAIGPCIAQESYEVDAQFRDRFLDDDTTNAAFFVPGKAGHYQFDIAGYVADRLAGAGIKQVHQCSLDTYAAAQRYYSYRRSCHKGEAGYGRQISIIGLPQ